MSRIDWFVASDVPSAAGSQRVLAPCLAPPSKQLFENIKTMCSTT